MPRTAKNIYQRLKRAKTLQQTVVVLNALVESQEMADALEDKDFELHGEPVKVDTNAE